MNKVPRLIRIMKKEVKKPLGTVPLMPYRRIYIWGNCTVWLIWFDLYFSNKKLNVNIFFVHSAYHEILKCRKKYPQKVPEMRFYKASMYCTVEIPMAYFYSLFLWVDEKYPCITADNLPHRRNINKEEKANVVIIVGSLVGVEWPRNTFYDCFYFTVIEYE